jgi:hypothetical protein
MDTMTLKLDGRIFIPKGYTTQWPNEKGLPKMNGTAFIPSAQIKGGLRRAALRAVLAASHKKLPDIESYYFNAVGGAKGNKTGGKGLGTALSDLQDFRLKNPICGLFGGTDVVPGTDFLCGAYLRLQWDAGWGSGLWTVSWDA